MADEHAQLVVSPEEGAVSPEEGAVSREEGAVSREEGDMSHEAGARQDGTVKGKKKEVKSRRKQAPENIAVGEREQEGPKRDVCLLPSQLAHVSRMFEILRTSDYAFDFSCLGAGKTYATTHIAKTLGFRHCVCVCPVSVKSKWCHMRQEYGLPLQHLMGFCEMRSVRFKQPRHGLLVRRDYSVVVNTAYHSNQNVDKVDFTPTSKWARMVEEGVLLVIDEAQNLKNVTSQFAAAQALIRGLIAVEDARQTASGRGARASKVLLLSGTPFDKVDQVTTVCRLLGIMKREELGAFDLREREIRWLGMQDVHDFCTRLDPAATARVDAMKITRSDMRFYAYKLFQRVIKPRMSSSMPPPQIRANVTRYNAFYEVLHPDDRSLMREGVVDLANACCFDPERNTVNFAHTINPGGALERNGAIQAVTRALMRVETSKLRTIMRVCRDTLRREPRRKMVVCVNYNASIHDLREGLAEFSPLVLNGATSSDARSRVLERFQAPSTEHRLLIGNASVCSTGIDLDDKHGSFPRTALISPNYSTITLYQLVQRFIRADTKSDATVHFVFGKHAHEVNVLNALARKSAVMKETADLSSPSSSGGETASNTATRRIEYPGEYDRWEEPAELAHDA